MRCDHLRHCRNLVLFLVLLVASRSASARTIIMDARDCDRMASIAEAAPRQSWAMNERSTGTFDTARVHLAPQRSLLIRFPLSKIPSKQRIAHAELLLPLVDFGGNEPRFYLWRIIANWGAGVSYLNRLAVPDVKPWVKPGARGHSSDRATRPTDIVRLTERKEVAINVTEDVNLWYSGIANNNGWMLSVEDPEVAVYFASPLWEGSDQTWKLRITYEPQ